MRQLSDRHRERREPRAKREREESRSNAAKVAQLPRPGSRENFCRGSLKQTQSHRMRRRAAAGAQSAISAAAQPTWTGDVDGGRDRATRVCSGTRHLIVPDPLPLYSHPLSCPPTVLLHFYSASSVERVSDPSTEHQAWRASPRPSSRSPPPTLAAGLRR